MAGLHAQLDAGHHRCSDMMAGSNSGRGSLPIEKLPLPGRVCQGHYAVLEATGRVNDIASIGLQVGCLIAARLSAL